MGRREREPIIPNKEPISMGSAIRARRGALGYNLTKFSQMLGGYDPGYISTIENCSVKPSRELIEKIADVLILNDENQITNPELDEVLIWMEQRNLLRQNKTTQGKK